MKKNIADAWIAALRSGKYQQGTGRLIDVLNSTGDARYCCLGVLCELAEEAGVVKRLPNTISGAVQYPDTNDQIRTGVLPDVVADWAGMETNCGDFAEPSDWGTAYRSLMSMNDSGVPFSEIADIIEKNYVRL